MENKKFFPTTIVGVRLEGKNGWVIESHPATYEEVVKKLESKDSKIIETREIMRGLGRNKRKNDNPRIAVPLKQDLALHAGWAYDPYEKCWRAPEEMIAEPPGDPEISRLFHIHGDNPEFGWWPITIKLNKQTMLIHISNVYDPLHNIVKWLEKIIHGESAKTIITEENPYSVLSAYIKSHDNVRFVCHQFSENLSKNIDGFIEKKTLVSSFYKSIIQIYQNKELFNNAWAYEYIESGKKYPSLQSKTIESYLK